jgi:hypothetical protein
VFNLRDLRLLARCGRRNHQELQASGDSPSGIAPFQQKRYSGSNDNARPDQDRLDVRQVRRKEQNPCYQKQWPGEDAMIRPVFERIGKAAHGHSEQAGCRRGPVQRMPEPSDDQESRPRRHRYDEPVANGGGAATTHFLLAHHE